jgi:hypothetical protein
MYNGFREDTMVAKEKTSDKGALVKKWAEHKPKEFYRIAPGSNQNGSGIYILYKGDDVYYVGLSKRSIRGRLRRHATVDHHKGKWDHFSFYQIPKKKYVKDIESMLLGTYRTKGNKVGGRLKKAKEVVVNIE